MITGRKSTLHSCYKTLLGASMLAALVACSEGSVQQNDAPPAAESAATTAPTPTPAVSLSPDAKAGLERQNKDPANVVVCINPDGSHAGEVHADRPSSSTPTPLTEKQRQENCDALKKLQDGTR